MAPISEDRVREALKGVKFPGFSRDIVSFGLVQEVKVDGTDVHVILEHGIDDLETLSQIKAQTQSALDSIEGVGVGYSETTLTIPNVGDCLSYVAEDTHIDDSLSPYDWYHELVMLGARTHSFPNGYLKQIELEQSFNDPDQKRSAEKWNTVEMIRGGT